MRYLFLIILIYSLSFASKSEISLKAKTPEEKDLICMTLLKIASEKSKKDGEMIKFEKLKKLGKSYSDKYKEGHFSDQNIKLQIENHNLKVSEKGQRYINKGLQKCGLK